jgi:O-antigen/teichoic acid export membrane protein
MSYWRNLSSVLVGSIVAQILPVLGSIVIVRQYSPNEFGIYSIWLGFTLFIAVCLTGRLENSLPTEEDGEPRRLAVIYVLSTIIILLCILFSAFIFLNLIVSKYYGLLPLKYIYFSIVASGFMAFVQTWQTWAAAEGFYKKLSIIRIVQAGSVITFQIIIGIFQKDAAGLILGQILGLFISLLVCFFIMPIGANIVTSEFGNRILNFWKKNKKFPIFSLPADAINSASSQLPLILIGSKFGAEMAGYFALTFRVLGAPIGLLGSSALDVFKRHAAVAYRERGECLYEYLHTLKTLSVLTIISSFSFFFFAKSLFVVAFGKNWIMSGEIAVWLIPLFALRFVASPLSYMVYIAGKQHLDLGWQISLFIVTMTTINFIPSFKIAIMSYSLSYTFLYIIYLFMSYKLSLGHTNDRNN